MARCVIMMTTIIVDIMKINRTILTMITVWILRCYRFLTDGVMLRLSDGWLRLSDGVLRLSEVADGGQ